MQRRRVFVRATLGAALLVGGFGVGTAARAESWADGLFAEHATDFGPVPRGAKVRHNFVLTNKFAEPVTILDVRASCGCTSGRALAGTIEPGKTGVVEAEMDTRNFVGRKATTLFVSVVTPSGRSAEARLGVQSTILSDIVLNPGSVDFGQVARGQSPKLVVTIDRVGAPNWKAERMLADPRLSQAIDASLVETARANGTVSYALTITLKADAPAGALRDDIKILTNDRESPVVPILVTGQVQGTLSASPSLLALGRVESAGGVQGRYIIRGSQPFAIAGIEGNGDGFTLAAADAKSPKTLHILNLAYKPEAGTTRGDLTRHFKVRTSLPGEPPVELNATLHVDP